LDYLASSSDGIIDVNGTAEFYRSPRPLYYRGDVHAIFDPAYAFDQWLRPRYWDHEVAYPDMSRLHLYCEAIDFWKNAKVGSHP
jgi:hypothetical protein